MDLKKELQRFTEQFFDNNELSIVYDPHEDYVEAAIDSSNKNWRLLYRENGSFSLEKDDLRSGDYTGSIVVNLANADIEYLPKSLTTLMKEYFNIRRLHLEAKS